MRVRLVVAAACAALATSARALPWVEASSAHFVIVAQDRPEAVRAFAERLERFDRALRLLRRMDDPPMPPSTRLTVYVLPDQAMVGRLAGSPDAAGFYRPTDDGSVAYTSRDGGSGHGDLTAQIVLLHEYTHHFMFRNFAAAYPSWFSEGFAEFNGTARLGDDGSVTIGVPANHRAYDIVSLDAPRLARLMADDHGAHGITTSEVYGYGWLVTHYLTFSPERRGQLTAYLDAINRGTPPLDAAKGAFGDLDRLKREVTAWSGRRRMPTLTIPAARLPIGPIAVRVPGPAEQAMLPIALRERAHGDGIPDRPEDRARAARTAAAIARDARTAAAAFPDDAAAQTILAAAELDAGMLDAAAAAADRAVKGDPAGSRGWLVKARIGLARAAAATGEAAAPLLRQVRSDAARANRADPDAPAPLALYFASYAAAGDRPPAMALAGLVRAQELAPEDADLRMTLAARYVADGSATAARTLLAPIAYSAHADKRRDSARAMLARLDGTEATAAATTAPAAPPR